MNLMNFIKNGNRKDRGEREEKSNDSRFFGALDRDNAEYQKAINR